MPRKQAHSSFYPTMQSQPFAARGPVASNAIQQDSSLVLEKASSLLGYGDYPYPGSGLESSSQDRFDRALAAKCRLRRAGPCLT
jgi:hypothetical protein